MPVLALSLYVVFAVVAFGLRTAIQIRRTGSSGVHRLSGPPGSAEWLASVGFLLALAMGASWRIGVDPGGQSRQRRPAFRPSTVA